MAKTFVTQAGPRRQPTAAESAAASMAVFGPPKPKRAPDAAQDRREARARARARQQDAAANAPGVRQVRKMEKQTAPY